MGITAKDDLSCELDKSRTWLSSNQFFLSAVAVFSMELHKGVPGQPSAHDVLEALLKECRKENLRYKIVALRCTADVLKTTQENRFQELTDIIFPIIKKVNFPVLLAVEYS